MLVYHQIIFLDLWSIIHITGGLLIMLLLIKLRKKNKFTILIAVLLVWELFEFTNYQILKNSFFVREKITDVVWDIAVGIGGGTIANYVKN